jgi:uncharacterized protein (TIGR03083 family)
MSTTVTDLGSLRPLGREDAVALGRVEYRRFVDAIARLEADEWRRPTDCEGWAVRDLAGHLAGSMTTVSSFSAFLREQVAVARRAKRTGEAPVDAMTAIQVERMAGLTTEELIARAAALVDAAADGRRKVPAAIARLVRFKVEMGAISETWKLDYLLGPILTRDTWLHRVSDLARAIERAPELDGAHDGRIVADVAGEWASRHGEPVELVLDGPAGGRFTHKGGGERIEVDAIEFCRILSGRAEPTHRLLATAVPF